MRPEPAEAPESAKLQPVQQIDDVPRLCLATETRHSEQRLNTIDEIKTNSKCPNKFRLQARIVDFFPLDISDFTARWCRNCKQPYVAISRLNSALIAISYRIPENRIACTMCEDGMAEYVTWVFRFFLMVEDEAGDKLVIDCCNEGVSGSYTKT